jgi:hypothetical protein
MRDEEKSEKKNNNQWRSEIQNTQQHKRVHDSLMEIQIKTKKHLKKNAPPPIFKIKQSLCHSFLELILLLTHCQ